MSRISQVVITVAAVLVATPALAQPPMPTPGPEHAIFKMDEGTWDATIELTPGPGMPSMTSTGVETNTIGCGGLCLVTDFKGELMPGMNFHGHGLTTWDSAARKYVGTWTDSMSSGLASMTGTYDSAAKKMTTTTENRDPSGALVKSRSVSEYPAPDRRVMTMYAAGPDGKENQTLRITYTRQK
jgi:hypothetical protein